MNAPAAPCSLAPDPGPAPGLAQVATVPSGQPAVVGGKLDQPGLFGLRHMRLGFGLGGGFAG